MQPGHRPHHHGPHLLVAPHAQVRWLFKGVAADVLKNAKILQFQSVYEPVRGVERAGPDDL